MEFGYCATTLIPCRAEASDKSEMINQLLFGETYEVLETQEKWVNIKTIEDKYESWIDRKLHRPLSESEWQEFQSSEKLIVDADFFPLISLPSEQRLILSHGAILSKPSNGSFSIGPDRYKLSEYVPNNQSLSTYSKHFLNTPYLWGGKSLFGADCSGFTQVIFRAKGINIPRDAYQQAKLGTPQTIETVQAGDLAFFGKPDGKITHVGIAIEDGKIIHCAGKCRMDTLDSTGILNSDTGLYTHELRSIKRIK